jgi:hypothetical protein
MNVDKSIRRQETTDLLLGKLKRQTLAVAAPFRRRPLTTARPTSPLGLAEQRARARWQKPVAAIIADALASNRGLLERLKRGMHGPDMKGKEQYQVLFNGLYQTTQEQIEALEMFAKVDWSE